MNAVPSVNQALVLLSSHTQACLASPKIRTALGKRLEESEGLRKYMDEMDHELMGTSMGQSFNQQGTNKAGPAGNGCPRSPSGEGLLGEDEEIQPLDIDLNMVTNLLEPLSSRAGRAGL
ncbi:protein ecdysoneless homolog isoform X2 [Oncorhynchus clarkii lewisi]|uniref:protein ecdysoneless homolog isoform X2 n=1 Tax=Oncorhynchus clarkii lewisi TaxID=490388 RepID=UPI0039B8B6D6